MRHSAGVWGLSLVAALLVASTQGCATSSAEKPASASATAEPAAADAPADSATTASATAPADAQPSSYDPNESLKTLLDSDIPASCRDFATTKCHETPANGGDPQLTCETVIANVNKIAAQRGGAKKCSAMLKRGH